LHEHTIISLLPRGIAENDADIAKDREALAAGLNRWGPTLLHFGTSRDFIACPEK
jgi:hypothetical protein